MSVSVRSPASLPSTTGRHIWVRVVALAAVGVFTMGNACVSIRPTDKEDTKAKAAASKNNCAACNRMCEVAGDDGGDVGACKAKCEKSCDN